MPIDSDLSRKSKQTQIAKGVALLDLDGEKTPQDNDLDKKVSKLRRKKLLEEKLRDMMIYNREKRIRE